MTNTVTSLSRNIRFQYRNALMLVLPNNAVFVMGNECIEDSSACCVEARHCTHSTSVGMRSAHKVVQHTDIAHRKSKQLSIYDTETCELMPPEAFNLLEAAAGLKWKPTYSIRQISLRLDTTSASQQSIPCHTTLSGSLRGSLLVQSKSVSRAARHTWLSGKGRSACLRPLLLLPGFSRLSKAAVWATSSCSSLSISLLPLKSSPPCTPQCTSDTDLKRQRDQSTICCCRCWVC